jgi:hypothetical protein
MCTGSIELVERRREGSILGQAKRRRQFMVSVRAVAPFERIQDTARRQRRTQAGEPMLQIGRPGFMRADVDQISGHAASGTRSCHHALASFL